MPAGGSVFVSRLASTLIISPLFVYSRSITRSFVLTLTQRERDCQELKASAKLGMAHLSIPSPNYMVFSSPILSRLL